MSESQYQQAMGERQSFAQYLCSAPSQFDWNRARAFLVTAEEGSLSAAARALGMTQPTVGRQVAALEKELNIILFDRVGKQLVLTPSGLELVDYVRQMSDAAARVSLVASGQSQQLDGEVCITAIDSIAALCLPPIIKKVRKSYPGISIEVIASNEICCVVIYGLLSLNVALRISRNMQKARTVDNYTVVSFSYDLGISADSPPQNEPDHVYPETLENKDVVIFFSVDRRLGRAGERRSALSNDMQETRIKS